MGANDNMEKNTFGLFTILNQGKKFNFEFF
jgi:hypothetical protein